MPQGGVPTVVPSRPSAVPDAELPPDLARVVAAWADLPDAIKAGVLALVHAAAGDRGAQRNSETGD